MDRGLLIRQEIEWCKRNRGIKSKKFEDGFIAGLKQALLLLKSKKGG